MGMKKKLWKAMQKPKVAATSIEGQEREVDETTWGAKDTLFFPIYFTMYFDFELSFVSL